MPPRVHDDDDDDDDDDHVNMSDAEADAEAEAEAEAEASGKKRKRAASVPVTSKENKQLFYCGFPCGSGIYCRFSSGRKWALKRHRDSIHQGMTFACPKCNAPFSTKSKREEHEKNEVCTKKGLQKGTFTAYDILCDILALNIHNKDFRFDASQVMSIFKIALPQQQKQTAAAAAAQDAQIQARETLTALFRQNKHDDA